MNKHDLENMIFNLEERKGLKKVEFTQKAVVEILGYLKELQDLEAKLAESKKEYNDLKKIDDATKESLYASREYLDEETSKRWALEKQIEEMEASKINLIQNKEIADKVIAEYKEECKQLKQQLAIREQIIKENKDLYDAKLFEMSAMEENYTQDKIEFAVMQLNKLLDQTTLRGVSDWTTWVYCIKSQIKQLKEGK